MLFFYCGFLDPSTWLTSEERKKNMRYTMQECIVTLCQIILVPALEFLRILNMATPFFVADFKRGDIFCHQYMYRENASLTEFNNVIPPSCKYVIFKDLACNSGFFQVRNGLMLQKHSCKHFVGFLGGNTTKKKSLFLSLLSN